MTEYNRNTKAGPFLKDTGLLFIIIIIIIIIGVLLLYNIVLVSAVQ